MRGRGVGKDQERLFSPKKQRHRPLQRARAFAQLRCSNPEPRDGSLGARAGEKPENPNLKILRIIPTGQREMAVGSTGEVRRSACELLLRP